MVGGGEVGGNGTEAGGGGGAEAGGCDSEADVGQSDLVRGGCGRTGDTYFGIVSTLPSDPAGGAEGLCASASIRLCFTSILWAYVRSFRMNTLSNAVPFSFLALSRTSFLCSALRILARQMSPCPIMGTTLDSSTLEPHIACESSANSVIMPPVEVELRPRMTTDSRRLSRSWISLSSWRIICLCSSGETMLAAGVVVGWILGCLAVPTGT